MSRVILFNVFLFPVFSFAQPVTGVKTIPGNYSSITLALSEIESNGMIGTVILELQNTYTSAGEVFPIVFGSNLVTSSIDNIIIRPAANVTNELLLSTDTFWTIKFFNGGRFITIDGRPGGINGLNKLTISNTNVAGVTMSFQNNCSYDTIKYCKIKGANQNSNEGVVHILYGVQNIEFEGNQISDTLYKPSNLMYSSGASNVLVKNNIYYNHESSSGSSTGLYLGDNNIQWRIIGNRFFSKDTVFVFGPYNSYNEIFIQGGLVSQCSVVNNIFGPKLDGGNTVIMGAGTVNIIYTAVNANAVIVDSNEIRRLNVTCNDIKLIYTGNASYNRIGGVDSIEKVMLAVNSTVGYTSSLVWSSISSYNFIENVEIGGASTDMFYGIVGNNLTSNNFKHITINKPGEYRCMHGANVDSNLIKDIESYSMSSDSKLIGISGLRLTNNQISGLYSKSTITSTNGISITGILLDASNWNNNLCRNNAISNLLNQASSGISNTVCALDVQLSGNSTYHTISENSISNLMTKGASNSRIIGVNLQGGLCNLTNNTIAIGSDTAGYNIDSSYQIWGINKASTDKMNLLFNSITITGNNLGASSTFSTCLRRIGSSADSIYNNIFYNNRPALTSSSSKSYCVYNSSTSLLKSNHNVYFYDTASTFSYLGQFGITTATNISQLKSILLDSNSLLANPLFNTLAGRYNQINLRPLNSSPVESSGLNVLSVVFDKDFKTRVNYTATDIGAYSINANSVNTPSFTISVTPLSVSSISISIGPGSFNPKVVFVSTNSTLISFPQNCFSYTHNPIWKQGTMLDSVTSCVYDGTGSSIVVSGLTLNTTYYAYAVEYLTSNSFKAYVMPIVSANGMTLPVKLTQFTTSLNGKSVLNQWHTASELNNDYFELERSIDGQQWNVIGKVKGNGTTNQISNYEYGDNMLPSQPVKNLYYRLKQVDFDGGFDYSKINSISYQAQPIIAQVSPNPFQDIASIVIQSETEGYIDIVITNLSGVTLSNQRSVVGSGQNTIQINAIESLPHGMYFVSVTQGSQTLVLKMIH
jgi:hypothetical protein